MWKSPTFGTILPLFNVWGVFIPSQESGIGTARVPKDTTFGLYRDGNELRGVYCSKPTTARAACRLTGLYACDYPILIANDDYYGGLGGEFIISTRSPTSGSMVLRHEMSHAFISIGEEYDGGYVYSGVNAAYTLKGIKWEPWLTGPLREEKTSVELMKHPWKDVDKGPLQFKFTANPGYDQWRLQISVSGMDTDDSFKIMLDGQQLPWKSQRLLDRVFYEVIFLYKLTRKVDWKHHHQYAHTGRACH
jgi:hypothetical protein